MFGRGFATALCLVLIALACIAVARRFERERRLIAKLRRRDAFDADRALSARHLSDDERDTVTDLTRAGVLRERGGSHYIDAASLAVFRRKRVRVALSGALVALAVCAFVAAAILGR
ncbi:MAG TPA: hypothetical protein VJ011_08910 [Steroidobacteraceae bacterium]|nr:hypothetical protein [Steroidobacteraceae bacterium]